MQKANKTKIAWHFHYLPCHKYQLPKFLQSDHDLLAYIAKAHVPISLCAGILASNV